MGRDERNGNYDELFEWDFANEEWIPRATMPLTRGHASSSTVAANCGFIVAAGSSNGLRTIRYASLTHGCGPRGCECLHCFQKIPANTIVLSSVT